MSTMVFVSRSTRGRRGVGSTPAWLGAAALASSLLLSATLVAAGESGGVWRGFASDPQHTALSTVAAQSLDRIRWQTPVDLSPQYSGNSLLIHYGSPVVTTANTVIVPVKVGSSGGFRVEAHTGSDGAVLWKAPSDYVLPPHDWTPSFNPALTPSGRLYFPGAGGTVRFRDAPDAPTGPSGQIAFYGIAHYQARTLLFIKNVRINTPLTTDGAGNVFFGFEVLAPAPPLSQSGIARIDATGSGTWISAAAAVSDTGIQKVVHNSAPALSNDQSTLYVAVTTAAGTGEGTGYLAALDSHTLAPLAKVRLLDVLSGQDALLPEAGTASPTVGPDGDVYFGVLGNSVTANDDRGWLLHFDAGLTQAKIPGAFGWDDTASIVPAAIVPSYAGSSSYLVMTKYNNYAEAGGDGVNKVAVLDPNASFVDPVSGATVMNEVLTVVGPTPDPSFGHPNAVKEWCINSAVVDPFTKSIFVNSEDGKLYRWDLTTNTLSAGVVLTPGLGEAYTPTLIGADGTVYAINNATLFAVGQ
jgi:hypothetical protein